MVSFPDLSSISANDSNIGAILALPNSSYPYYWAWMLAGIWIITFSSLYFSEKEKTGRGKILSAMSVACFAIIILATIGTIVGFVSLEITIYILVVSLIIIGIWFFSQ